MALDKGYDEITTGVSSTTQFVFSEQPQFKDDTPHILTPIVVAANGDVSGGHFPKFQGVPSAVDLALAGALIDPGVFTGVRTRTEGYPGQLRGQGGVVLGGSVRIAPSLLRMLLQDRNPSYHILGGSGKTLPSEVTVVDSQALPSTAEKTIADTLASTVNPVRLTVTPKAAASAITINVVEDQALSGSSAKTIANNLNGYDTAFALRVALQTSPTPAFTNQTIVVNSADVTTTIAVADNLSSLSNALQLEFALSGTPSLTNANTPGTLTLTYTVDGGAAQTETLTFANTELTTAQRFDLPANATISSIVAAGFSDGDLDAVAYQPGTIRIQGTDPQGRLQTETLTFIPSILSTAQTTAKRFLKVTEVTATHWTAGEVDITVTLPTAVTLGPDSDFGIVRIEGTDHAGNTIADRAVFSDDNKTVAQTIDRHFATITKVTSSNFTGGAVDIKAQDKAVRVTSRTAG